MELEQHDILKAALNSRVAEVIPEPTPLSHLPRLSARVGRAVLLKREDQTAIFSFKLRGAYNRIARLDERARAGGVIAASAGNHAQGVAWAAARLKIPARVVIPTTTPPIKIEAVRRLGADVDLVGCDYAEAAAHCAALAEATGMIPIPPYDDFEVIAGQSTVGLEILRQVGADLGAIFVPVGGGGLAAGVAAVVKALRPEVRVIGVEPEDSDAMGRALAAGHPVTLERVGAFADGVAVRRVGELTYALCRRYLDECITVSIDQICAAIREVFEETRALLEPAGALATAGLQRMAGEGALARGAAVAIASGANLSFDSLARIAERAAACPSPAPLRER